MRSNHIVPMDTYRKLRAWKHCHQLTLAVYRATDRFPRVEQFGITAQVRRAAVSSCANLAEGSARRGPRELRRFAGIALGSLAEVDALLQIARDLGFLTEKVHVELRRLYKRASVTTFALLRSMWTAQGR